MSRSGSVIVGDGLGTNITMAVFCCVVVEVTFGEKDQPGWVLYPFLVQGSTRAA
jgi:hypothetical protein